MVSHRNISRPFRKLSRSPCCRLDPVPRAISFLVVQPRVNEIVGVLTVARARKSLHVAFLSRRFSWIDSFDSCDTRMIDHWFLVSVPRSGFVFRS